MNIDPVLVATLLTAAGAPLAAAVVVGVINFAKTLGAPVGGHERLLAFALSIVIVGVAVVIGLGEQPPRYSLDLLFLVGGALAIYNITRLAMAQHDDLAGYDNSLTGTSTGKTVVNPDVRMGP